MADIQTQQLINPEVVIYKKTTGKESKLVLVGDVYVLEKPKRIYKPIPKEQQKPKGRPAGSKNKAPNSKRITNYIAKLDSDGIKLLCEQVELNNKSTNPVPIEHIVNDTTLQNNRFHLPEPTVGNYEPVQQQFYPTHFNTTNTLPQEQQLIVNEPCLEEQIIKQVHNTDLGLFDSDEDNIESSEEYEFIPRMRHPKPTPVKKYKEQKPIRINGKFEHWKT